MVGEATAHVQGESLKAGASPLDAALSTPRSPGRGEIAMNPLIVLAAVATCVVSTGEARAQGIAQTVQGGKPRPQDCWWGGLTAQQLAICRDEYHQGPLAARWKAVKADNGAVYDVDTN